MERVANKKHKSRTWDDFLTLREESRIPEALSCLEELSENGDGMAKIQLGKAHYLGLYGLTPNKTLSAKYLKQSMHPLSNYYLHTLHKYPKNSIGTGHLFLKALDCLNTEKPHDYGKKDLIAMAISLFKKCGNNGVYESYFHLSQIDTKHRVQFLKQGALFGDEQCQIELCKFYESKLQYDNAWPFMKRYRRQCIAGIQKHQHKAIYDSMEKKENAYATTMCMLLTKYYGNIDNELWKFPKDIVKMIAKMVWNTYDEDIWLTTK